MSAISSAAGAFPLELLHAARSQVALFDVSDRSQIEIVGADRTTFLHGFTSNDIKRLQPGQGCETFVTNLKGKVVAHVFVFCTQHSLWLDGSPGQTAAVLTHLRKYLLIEDVQLIPRSVDRGELYLSGPLAAPLLQVEDMSAVLSHVTRETNGESFEIRKVDLLGPPGFLVSIPASQLEVVKRSFIALGVPQGSAADFELFRINAGFPRYGVDITDENLAQEVARTKQCISFNKGCYLGQETVARIDALGHTNQELRRMRFATNDLPVAGTAVFDAAGENEVGVITSSAPEWSNPLESPMGNPPENPIGNPPENPIGNPPENPIGNPPESPVGNPISNRIGNASNSIIALGLIKRVAYAHETAIQLRSGEQTIMGHVL